MSEPLRRLDHDAWADLREIRLRALADAPDAFGSTLAREEGFAESDWRERLTDPVVVVGRSGACVAMGGVWLDDGEPHIWGMWTDPAHRQRGHARRILDALLTPEVVAASSVVQLDVNVANAAARAAYEHYGFVGTGELTPLRDGSDQRIERMTLRPR